MSKLLSNLHVDSALQCELDGSRVSITAADRKLVVEVPDVATGLKLLQLGSSRASYISRLRGIKRLLDLTTHSLEVRIRGDTVVRLGHRIGNRWWRLLGLPDMTAKPRVILSLLVQQR